MSKDAQALVKLAHKLDMLRTPSYVNPYGSMLSKRASKLKFLSNLLKPVARKVTPVVRQSTHTDDITKQILSRQGTKSLHNATDVGEAVGKGDGFRNWFTNRLINTRYGRNLSGAGEKVTLNRGADGSRVLNSQTQAAAQASGRKMPVNKLNQPLQRTVPGSTQRVFNSGKDGLEESVNILTKGRAPTVQSAQKQVLHSGSGGSSNAFLNKHLPTFTNWGTKAKNFVGDVRQGFSLLPKELRYNVNVGRTQTGLGALNPKTWRTNPLGNASLTRSTMPNISNFFAKTLRGEKWMPAGLRRPLGTTLGAGAVGYGMAPESIGGLGGWGWTGAGMPANLMMDNVQANNTISDYAGVNDELVNANNQWQEGYEDLAERLKEVTDQYGKAYSEGDIQTILSDPELYLPMLDKQYGTDFSKNLTSFQGANTTSPDAGSLSSALMSVGGGGAAGLLVAQMMHKQKVKRYAEENGITEEQAEEELGGPSRLIPGLAGAAAGGFMNRDNLSKLFGQQ